MMYYTSYRPVLQTIFRRSTPARDVTLSLLNPVHLPYYRCFTVSTVSFSSPSSPTFSSSVSSSSVVPSLICYVNNQYLPINEAKISVEDRGFLFSDGVYEVTKVYSASSLSISSPHIFTESEHCSRLYQGLKHLHFPEAQLQSLIKTVTNVSRELIVRNNLGVDGDAMIYTQITRGVSSPRMHAFPNPQLVPPTIFMSAKPFTNPTVETLQKGVNAVTTIDTRWDRCDIKSISLLPNVLANEYAKQAKAYECLFLRKYKSYYILAEASHSNVFGVYKRISRSNKRTARGTTTIASTTSNTVVPSRLNPFADYVLVTHPLSKNILPGITRKMIMDRAHELGIKVKEGYVIYRNVHDGKPIMDKEKYILQECFVTATTTEIMPIVRIDDNPVGNGKVGPVTTALRNVWMKWVKDDYNSANKQTKKENGIHTM